MFNIIIEFYLCINYYVVCVIGGVLYGVIFLILFLFVYLFLFWVKIRNKYGLLDVLVLDWFIYLFCEFCVFC